MRRSPENSSGSSVTQSSVTAASVGSAPEQSTISRAAQVHDLEKNSSRIASLDVYRGVVMFLMLAEILHLSNLPEIFPGAVSDFIAFHTDHVEWTGCSLHDMIQPSFSFLVGAAMAFSVLARQKRGQSRGGMLVHAIGRSLILIFLGIFLRSFDNPQTDFTFDDTLTQIGLGYSFLFLISWLTRPLQWLVLSLILVGYWAAFALYTPSPEILVTAETGVPDDFPHHATGFASHWNKNANLAWAFDRWWMNLFPRPEPFRFSEGGYCTLSFIPTLGTMILGLLAGQWLRDRHRLRTTSLLLVGTGLGCMAAAWGVDAMGWCPIVKRIWTPTWTLWSGGLCFIALWVFHLLADIRGWTAWAYPFLVIGANSIVAYVMSWTLESPIQREIRRHFGEKFFGIQSQVANQMILAVATLLIMWLVLWWLYRRRVFVRI